MAARPKFKTDASAAIHSSASAVLGIDAIDKATMPEFDDACLTAPPALDPTEIKALHEANHVSQPVFARHVAQ